MFRTNYDLCSDVLEERENVKISSRHNLLEHRVDHDVAASPDDYFDIDHVDDDHGHDIDKMMMMMMMTPMVMMLWKG